MKAPKAAAKGSTNAKQQNKKISKPKQIKTRADKLTKKYTCGMVAQTEKMLGQRAGHLELIGKGRKAMDKSEKIKGGTRKFG